MNGPAVLMAESSDIHHDYRVQKEAGSVAGAGYRVVVYGFHNGWHRPDGAAFPYAVRTFPIATRRHRALRNASMAFSIAVINLIVALSRAKVYHAHNTMFLVGMWLGARLHGGRFIYDAHEVQWEKGRITAALERHFVRRADGVINVAPGRARACAERYGLPLETFTIVSNYPIVPEAAPPPAPRDARDGRLRLIYSGGFDLSNNRLDVLLAAMRDIPSVALDLMAFGYRDGEQVMRRLVEEYGLQDRVRFVPLVRPHEVMDAIRGHDVAVNLLTNPLGHVSIRHPSVNKMYEYLAAGLPILCSDLEGFVAEFADEGAAVAVDATDPSSIAAGLRTLAADRPRLESMRARAAELARMRYNWRTQEERLLGLYRKLTG